MHKSHQVSWWLESPWCPVQFSQSDPGPDPETHGGEHSCTEAGEGDRGSIAEIPALSALNWFCKDVSAFSETQGWEAAAHCGWAKRPGDTGAPWCTDILRSSCYVENQGGLPYDGTLGAGRKFNWRLHGCRVARLQAARSQMEKAIQVPRGVCPFVPFALHPIHPIHPVHVSPFFPMSPQGPWC